MLPLTDARVVCSSSYDTSVPSDDPVLQGTVVLTLPKPRRVKSVSVSLKISYELCFPNVLYVF